MIFMLFYSVIFGEIECNMSFIFLDCLTFWISIGTIELQVLHVPDLLYSFFGHIG